MAKQQRARRTTTVEDCKVCLVGIHTKSSKSPGVEMVMGLFPTEEATKVYVNLLGNTFGDMVTFTTKRVGIKQVH